MLNLRRWLILLSFFLFITNTAIAQDDDDVVRVNTELVVINVTVTDGAGNYVRKLRASDFQVFEDGKLVDPKLIVGFALQESPYASVVLIDSSGSMEQRMILARSGAIRFLDGLRDEDVAAIYDCRTHRARWQFATTAIARKFATVIDRRYSSFRYFSKYSRKKRTVA